MEKFRKFLSEKHYLIIGVSVGVIAVVAAVLTTVRLLGDNAVPVSASDISSADVSSDVVSSDVSSDVTSSKDASSEVISSAPVQSKAPVVSKTVSTLSPDHPYYNIIKEAEKYPNDGRGYGFGLDRDAANRPLLALSQQNAYGHLGMVTIDLNVPEGEKVVYLTMDEGYEAGYTPKILDILKEKGVTATFFVTQSYCYERPGLVKRMIDEGHVVGNHSVHHYSMPTISPEAGIPEIMGLHNYMLNTYGYEMHLFRPPTGAYSQRTLRLAQLLGYKTVEWSFAYGDYDEDNQPDKTYAYDYITSRTCNGCIYLLHAISKTNTEILGDLIDYWQGEGYTVKAYAG